MAQTEIKQHIKKKHIKKCKRLIIITTSTKSNFFVVLGHEYNGLVRIIKQYSAGQVGGKGKTKTSTYIMQTIMNKVIGYIKDFIKIEEGIEIVMRGIEGGSREFVLNSKAELMSLAPVLSVESKHDAAHGGVTARRARRV